MAKKRNPDLDNEPVTALTLDSREQLFMARVMRFLVGIQSPLRAPRARREGYTADEHKHGWSLWRMAAGESRSLDQYFAETRDVEESPDRQRTLRELDLFENTWFPRVRAIIRRVVPEDARDSFERGFFKDLAQQPLGPAVVGSVGTLLSRIEGLASSKQEGASKVAATLSARGLDKGRITEVRALITSLENESRLERHPVDPADIREAQEAQLAALEELRAWFNDWATTLRSVFFPRDQAQLGLLAVRRDGTVEEAVAEGDEAEVEGTLATPPKEAAGGSGASP
jgi:hypothetical protein